MSGCQHGSEPNNFRAILQKPIEAEDFATHTPKIIVHGFVNALYAVGKGRHHVRVGQCMLNVGPDTSIAPLQSRPSAVKLPSYLNYILTKAGFLDENLASLYQAYRHRMTTGASYLDRRCDLLQLLLAFAEFLFRCGACVNRRLRYRKIDRGNFSKDPNSDSQVPNQSLVVGKYCQPILNDQNSLRGNLSGSYVLLHNDLLLNCVPGYGSCQDGHGTAHDISGKADPIRRLDGVTGRDSGWNHHDYRATQYERERNKPQRAQTGQRVSVHRYNLPRQQSFVERLAA